MFGAGVWPTMLTSHRAAPLLAEGALVACTIAWAQGAYTGSAIYDAAKACIARFAFAMAHDLRERRRDRGRRSRRASCAPSACWPRTRARPSTSR